MNLVNLDNDSVSFKLPTKVWSTKQCRELSKDQKLLSFQEMMEIVNQGKSLEEILKNEESFVDFKVSLFAFDDKEILKLAKPIYKIFNLVERIKDFEIYPDRCFTTASAILNSNIFNHSHFKYSPSLENLETILTNSTSTVISLGVSDADFENIDKKSKFFPGHNFVIVKLVVKGIIKYKIFQSFVLKYSLKEDIQNHKNQWMDYENLKRSILDPFLCFCTKRGFFNFNDCANFKSVVHVDLDLNGYCPKTTSLSLKELVTYKHTYNQ